MGCESQAMLGDGQVGYQGNSSSKEQHQHRLPGGVTIPEVSQSHGDVTLGDVAQWGGAGGLGGLLQPSWCHQ